MTKIVFALCSLISLIMMLYLIFKGKNYDVFFISTLICGTAGAIISKIEKHSK